MKKMTRAHNMAISPQPKQIDLLKLSADDITMSSVASYDYPNDEDRPRSVSQLAKSYQQNTSAAISPPSYYNSTSSSLSYTKSTSNIEPPEQISPHSVLSTNNTKNMSGSTATAEDPPEQSLATKFNMSVTSNTHSRIRANIMSTSSIHNISRNAKGHVYLNGEDSSVDDISSSSCGHEATFKENKSVKIANEVHKIEPYGNTNNNNHQQREIMLGRNGRKLNPSSAIVLDKHLSSSSSSSPTIKQKQLSKKEQRERNSISLAKQFNYNNNNHTSPSPGQTTYEYKEKLKDDDSHVNYGYKVEDTTTQSNNKRDVGNRVKFADKYDGQISKTRSWDEEEGVYSNSNQGSRLGSNSSSNTKGAWRGNTQSSCDASVGSTETRHSNVMPSSPTTSLSSKPTVQYVTSSLSSTSRYTKSNFPPSYFRGVRTKKLPTFHSTNNKSSWLCGACGGQQQHGYLKKNAAILIVLVCIVCITTLSYFGLGGGTNEGIENQLNHIETTGYATSGGSNIRGLTDDYNNQQQQLPMTAGYAQEMGYSTNGQEQQSTKGIMDGVHPLPSFSMGNTNNNGVIDWSTTSQTTTGVGGQQVVDWSKVPPHLRGYYSKMVNVNAAQQSEQEQVISLEEQIDQGTSAQALLVESNVETVNVETTIDNIGEVAVPVIDMEEFTKQQEVLEFNAGVAGIQEPPPTVDDQSSLPIDGSQRDVLPVESLQGIASISDENNIPDQVENTDGGSIIEGQEEEEELEYGMTMEEHEQMEQRIQQEEAEKLAIERLELQRGGGDQLSGGQQVVEILPATTVPGEDVQQQELLEQQSLELQGDAYNDQETLLTSINEEELERQKQAEEDALLKAGTIEEDQRASREQNPPELDDEVAESEEQLVMNVSEEEAPVESLSPQEEVDQLENVQDQEETGQVLLDNEVQAEGSLNEQQQLDNEPQEVNQQENNDEDEIRIKKKKGKKKQKELEKLLKKEQKFQQRKQERIEQLKKDRREAKKRKKQNQDDESNDSEIIEDGATTIDQLQKELNELAALLSQKT